MATRPFFPIHFSTTEHLEERSNQPEEALSPAVFSLWEDNESRTDLVIVGSHLKRTSIARVVKDLEAEIGKELNYAVLETPDFQYRLNACDKFVRDIFDYPHHIILDKIGVANTPIFLAGLSTVR